MIPENQIGNFRIVKERDLTILYEGDLLWMQDDVVEKKSHQFAIDKCEGKILIAGLGIGYIVEELTKKEDVKEIVVVEIAPEVIELVWEYIDTSKSRIICDDISNYLKNTKEKFDYIYLDTIDSFDENAYPKMITLRELAENLVPPDKVLQWDKKRITKNGRYKKNNKEI